MKNLNVSILVFILAGLGAATSAHAALGTSAAVDPQGRLWIARIESEGTNAHVVLVRSDDRGATWQAPIRVTAAAEPVSADGENRPKLAFGPEGEIYVSWTSPTSAHYTGDIHFARSLDGGTRWSAPRVVHRDRQLIAHRFESMLVDGEGRVWIAWIDKRDLAKAAAAKREYAGAAIYYAWSADRGEAWHGDYKLADHSCECCRIALAKDTQGRASALWRHVFAPNERDHAFAVLDPKHEPARFARVTFDRWRIDACPHHGPSLAFTPDGVRHAVWFNQVRDQGRVFFGRLGQSGASNIQALPAGASHADIAAAGDMLALAWKRFDGEATKVESWISTDGGEHFSPGPVLQTGADSDQPRLVSAGEDILLVWRRAEDIVVRSLTGSLKPFQRDTLTHIERRLRGSPFWLVLWDLECGYCMRSLANLAEARRRRPDLKIVTVAADRMTQASDIRKRLLQLGVSSDAYAFSGASQEALRYAIDPAWMGEKPRAYKYDAKGARTPVSGVVSTDDFCR